jgi:hypothetical protein
MSQPTIDEITASIESMHSCKASYVDDIVIVEQFGSETVWEGMVHIFSLTGHPQADKCYAWASPIEGSKKYRYYAVLHIPPVDSPEKAVRASIVHDYKKRANQ